MSQDNAQDPNIGGDIVGGGDDSISLDLGSMKGLEPIPAGRVLATVTQCEKRFGQDSGEPYFAMVWAINEPQKYVGRRVFYNMSFSPKAEPFTKRNLVALGFDKNSKVKLSAPALVGTQAVLVLSVREYEGELQNNVKRLMPASTPLGTSEDAGGEDGGISI